MTANKIDSQPLAEVAADKLWLLQLRRENKAILEQLFKNEQRRQELMEANQKRFDIGEEKILKLEARIAQLEHEHTSKIQLWEKFNIEQKAQAAELKVQIKQFLQSRNLVTEDQIRDIIMQKGQFTDNGKLSNALDQKLSNESPSTICCLQPVQSYISSSNELNYPQTAKRSIKTRAKKPDDSKRSNTRNEILSFQHNSASNLPQNTDVTNKLPKLVQGRKQLGRYFEQAGLARTSIAFTSEQTEIDFVNSFIRGITSSKIREKLIGHLQQIHPSKQKKDGRVEILCDWTQLGLLIENFSSNQRKDGVVRKNAI